MTAPTALTVATIWAVVFTLTRVTGFGGALLGVPLVSLVVGPHTAVTSTVVLAVASTGYLAFTLRAHADRAVLRRVAPGVLVGLVPGAFILRIVDAMALRLILAGAVIGGAALVLARRNRPPIALPGWIDSAVGAVVGLLTTSVSTNGPPIVVLLQARGLAPDEFRATVSATFTVASTAGVAVLLATRQLDHDTLMAVAVALPGLVLGQLAGLRLARRVPATWFPSLVVAMLAASVVSLGVGIVRT